MSQLTKKRCIPCEGAVKPFTSSMVSNYKTKLTKKWEVKKNKKISREFIFNNFKEAIKFVNNVAIISEREGHHPDIHIFYNKVIIELWTHSIGGLSENDFIIAAKIENIQY